MKGHRTFKIVAPVNGSATEVYLDGQKVDLRDVIEIRLEILPDTTPRLTFIHDFVNVDVEGSADIAHRGGIWS